MSVSPYGMACLVNSIARAINSMIDTKSWNDRATMRTAASAGVQPIPGSEPKLKSQKTQAIINASLGAVCTGAAFIAATSDDEDTQKTAWYAAVASGTVLTVTNAVRAL